MYILNIITALLLLSLGTSHFPLKDLGSRSEGHDRIFFVWEELEAVDCCYCSRAVYHSSPFHCD